MKIHTTILTYLAALSMLGAGTRGCSMLWNNKTIEAPTHTTHSYATGITGHVEYTAYSDGSQEFKQYPGLSHRTFDSKLFQDTNGDGLIDRIRTNGAEWKMNSLRSILVRSADYDANEVEFTNADSMLGELVTKYN